MLRYLSLLLFLTSCSHPSLTVQSDYWTPRDLASMHVDTPDPRKSSSDFGQRLNISWYIPKKTFKEGPCELVCHVRLKNQELKVETVPLHTACGSYSLQIVGDDFFKKGGLLSYLIELKASGHTIASSQHKFWAEPIIVQ